MQITYLLRALRQIIMKDKVVTKNISIAIVGLGYVGFPTALAFHNAGFKTMGIDISQEKINLIRNRENPLEDKNEDIKIPIESQRWRVSTSFEDIIPQADVILITVPTPVDINKKPDLKYINSAAKSIINNLNREKKSIVVLESTVYPGVTREIIGNLANDAGMHIGKDLEIAYCPERVSPGDKSRSVDSVARIIGCDDDETGEILASLYKYTTSESSIHVGKIEVAEAAKMVENVQRDIDIALSNELAMILPMLGIDVEDVLNAASTKWNFHRHTPGIGVGGHCIPVDPYYYMSLAESVGFKSILSSASRKINNGMPKYAFEQIEEILGNVDNKNILILGYSYKADLGDIRETPLQDFTRIAINNDANVFVWDPLVEKKLFPRSINHVKNLNDIRDIDMVVIGAAHEEVIEIEWSELMLRCRTRNIYDGRRILNKKDIENMGWTYNGIGVPK